MKSILFMLLALAAVITLPAPEARAAQGAPTTPGHMRAGGKGVVNFQGAGHFEFRLHNKGVLIITDAANHQIQLLGQGNVTVKANGNMVIKSFKGKVDVVGQGIKGTFRKGRIEVAADGKGMATLKGKGFYKTNGSPPGQWTAPQPTAVSW